jgi:hypothetical protein
MYSIVFSSCGDDMAMGYPPPPIIAWFVRRIYIYIYSIYIGVHILPSQALTTSREETFLVVYSQEYTFAAQVLFFMFYGLFSSPLQGLWIRKDYGYVYQV